MMDEVVVQEYNTSQHVTPSDHYMERLMHTNVRKICNFTVNRDQNKK